MATDLDTMLDPRTPRTKVWAAQRLTQILNDLDPDLWRALLVAELLVKLVSSRFDSAPAARIGADTVVEILSWCPAGVANAQQLGKEIAECRAIMGGAS